VRPRRSAHPANFPACGNVAALQAVAAAARTAGRECRCAPLARTAPVPGGHAVPGGRLVWADADTPDAVTKARELCRTVPARLVVESAGAGEPGEQLGAALVQQRGERHDERVRRQQVRPREPHRRVHDALDHVGVEQPFAYRPVLPAAARGA
jgi:hypothetical protein